MQLPLTLPPPDLGGPPGGGAGARPQLALLGQPRGRRALSVLSRGGSGHRERQRGTWPSVPAPRSGAWKRRARPSCRPPPCASLPPVAQGGGRGWGPCAAEDGTRGQEQRAPGRPSERAEGPRELVATGSSAGSRGPRPHREGAAPASPGPGGAPTARGPHRPGPGRAGGGAIGPGLMNKWFICSHPSRCLAGRGLGVLLGRGWLPPSALPQHPSPPAAACSAAGVPCLGSGRLKCLKTRQPWIQVPAASLASCSTPHAGSRSAAGGRPTSQRLHPGEDP